MARWSFKKRIYRGLLHIFFPNRCVICDEIIEYDQTLCKKCETKFEPHTTPVCKKCGTPVKDHDVTFCKGICCPVVTTYYYNDEIKRLIIEFKNHHRDDIFDAFHDRVIERIISEYSDIDFDIVASVPSYKKKRYSTSDTMAREIAEAFKLNYDKNLLIKYRKTEKQHMLSQAERHTNLTDSITYNSNKKHLIKDKTILLCDDVKTTGVTLDECAKALYNAGAKQVCCICIAVSDYLSNLYKDKVIKEKLERRELEYNLKRENN